MSTKRLRFGAFELDLLAEELFRDGKRVKLASQPFRVLVALVSRPGAVVSRDELQKSVWDDGVHVDFEGSLHSCIKQIRAALGDDRSNPKFIETLPRRGYRFLPPVAVPRRSARTVLAGLAVILLLGGTLVARFREPVPDSVASVSEELALKGSYILKHGERDALGRAGSYFEESIRHDPDFAPAHVGLAEANLRRAMETGNRDSYTAAETSARRALSLTSSAEAEFVLALSRWYGAWDWDEAGDAFRRSLAEDPDVARAHHWYAYYLTGLGRHPEAILEIERAKTLDPLSAEIQSDVAWFYYFAGRYDDAIAASLLTLELEPSFLLAQDCLVESYLAKGEEALALEEAHRFLELARVAERVESLPDFWQVRFERAVAGFEGRPDGYQAGIAAVRLGRKDEAFVWLRAAVDAKSLWIPVLHVDPRLASMRPAPELSELHRSIGLP